MRLKDKTVWLVGASGGIGEYVAYECARKGADLVLSARRLGELERVAEQCRSFGAQVTVYPLDVTSPDQIKDVSDQVLKTHSIDILINNAEDSEQWLTINL